ncbi:uncharacterized protein LOC134190491 [Corticium candelabrum]|uniref:uncharacterized protein LOC134190491 n=1 Tax=Corticium candelabrum TaxID=121492 RepID=UPI002E274FE1|nr:uncharacterized protein LOC134190491 [Corticium candelabrum]
MDVTAAGATLTVVIIMGMEIYDAAREYRNGRLQLRRTDFLSRIWSAVVRATLSVWKEVRNVYKHTKKEKETEPEDQTSSKRSLRDAATKVKASLGRGRLLKLAAKQEAASSRGKDGNPPIGSMGSKRNLVKKPTSRTMAAMLVR